MGRGTHRGGHGRGFTLPEILTVLAIISLTLLIVVPTFTGGLGAGGLKRGARGLTATLNEARRLAITNRDTYCVVIDCNALSTTDETAIPVTRYWIARVDLIFDPATDPTDLPDADAAAPFDGEFTTLEPVSDPEELPPNIVVVAASIQSTDFQGDDFAPFRMNAMRTEDINLDGGVTDVEDVGVDGVNSTFAGGGNGAITGRDQAGFDPVDAGEDDEADDDEDPATGGGEDIDTIYRVIRFGPQGNADRASIWLWNLTDEGAPLPSSVAENSPVSLRRLGLPPGLTIQATDDQRNYFSVSDQSKDTKYYTIEVNPVTGQAKIFDYARGTGTAGPPADWNAQKDGEL